jgi:RHS repeat-associated protein
VLDQAADFVLTGKTPGMVDALVGAGTQLLERAAMARFGGMGQWMMKKLPSLGKLWKHKPGVGKKQSPPPARPPDKPSGGKSKGARKEPKSDKPSDCCPKNAAPAGKPVSGRKPVHFGTGEEVLYQTDFVLEGPSPLAWTRCYRSGSEHEDWGLLGARWASPFTSALLLTARGIIYVEDSGRGIRLPLLAVGQSIDRRDEGFVLTREKADSFELTWRDGSRDTFARDVCREHSWLPHGYDGVNAMLEPGEAVRAERFSLRRSAGRDGNGVSIESFRDVKPGGLLLRVRQDDGHILEAMREQTLMPSHEPRIGQVDEVRPDGERIRHVRYVYEAEAAILTEAPSALPERFNLVSQTNIAGHARHYRYRHHLLQSCTSYSGFRHILSWVSLEELRARWRGDDIQDGIEKMLFPITLDNSYQARATMTAGEDGSDALQLDYPSTDATRVTDAVGGVLEYTFDNNWLAVEVRRINVDNSSASLGRRHWDRDGMLMAEINAEGNGTRYTYDGAGNLTSTTDALGRTSRIEYDGENQPIALTDPLGHTSRLHYDASGRITTYIDALGCVSEYLYDGAGRLTQVRDAKGGIKRLDYDPVGRVIAYTDCSGNRSEYRYGAENRLSEAIDARQQKIRYEYDLLGRLLRVTRADGTSDAYAYDADGNLLTHTDALGHSTTYRYTGQGQPFSRTDALGQTLGYRYDAALRLVELINGNDERYLLEYNSDGWLVAETGFDGKTTRYSYDSGGQLTASDCLGQHVALLRDVCGQLLAKQTGSGVTRFAYDAGGRLTAVAAPHAEQRFVYDALGQLVEERTAYYLKQAVMATGPRVADVSFMMTHAYDELGNRIQTVLPNGRRLDILRYGAGHWHGTLWQGEQLVAVERDTLHRETVRRIGAGSRPLRAERSYDPQSRLASITLRDSDNADAPPVRERYFSYDAVGNLLSIEHGDRASVDNPGTFRYAYDPIGQLLSAVQPGLTEIFAFDPAGNLIEAPSAAQVASSETSPHVEHNLLKLYQGYRYSYDEQGNVVSKRPDNGKAGTSARELELAYDDENRLIRSVCRDAGTRSIASYLYDAFSRRIAKTVIRESWLGNQNPEMDMPAQAEEHTVRFVWDGDTIVQELHPGVTVTYVYEPETFVPLARVESKECVLDQRGCESVVEQFVYLWPVDDWLPPSQRGNAQEGKQSTSDNLRCRAGWQQYVAEAGANAATDSIAHYNCDHLGTPRELVDANGRILWSIRSLVWGRTLDGGGYSFTGKATVTDIQQPLRFQGQYDDLETGLHYSRYRYYDPDLASFLSQDPIRLMGGVHSYRYAPNPIAWIDPLGLAKCNSNSSCNPCFGKNPAAEAMSKQGTATDPSNPYSQIDSFENYVLRKGTILYSLVPGGVPGFAVTNHTLLKAIGSVEKYHDLTQVTPGLDKAGNPRPMRSEVRVYRINIDICVARSIAKANTQFGKGGAVQYYVAESDFNKLTMGKIRKI